MSDVICFHPDCDKLVESTIGRTCAECDARACEDHSIDHPKWLGCKCSFCCDYDEGKPVGKQYKKTQLGYANQEEFDLILSRLKARGWLLYKVGEIKESTDTDWKLCTATFIREQWGGKGE